MSMYGTLPWGVRLGTMLRLAWVWVSVPRLPAPTVSDGVAPGRGQPVTLVGFGDSIIAGIGVATHTGSLVAQVAAHLSQGGRSVRWISVGRSGATAPMLDAMLDGPVTNDPDIILVSCGVNDVVRGRAPHALAGDFRRFARRARERWPTAVVVHAGIPPLERFPALAGRLGEVLGRHGRSCIGAVRSAAIAADALYVPFPADVYAAHFARDGFHPNERGCAIWGKAVAQSIEAAGIEFPEGQHEGDSGL